MRFEKQLNAIQGWEGAIDGQKGEIHMENIHTFFSFHNARRPTPDTFTTLNRTPGISPFALPRRPKPEMRTSSFSSTKFKQPSFYDLNQLHSSNF